MKSLVGRAKIIRSIREFFWAQDFIETDTPTLVLSPGMEPHIRPIKTEIDSIYLPTSPEFAMKRLLAKGQKKIFQICKSYRSEPKSATHNPEFTILEWYRSNAGYEMIMEDVQNLFAHISTEIYGSCEYKTGLGNRRDVRPPWPKYSVEEAFRTFIGIELAPLLKDLKLFVNTCIERKLIDQSVMSTLPPEGCHSELELSAIDDLFFRLMLNFIEPELKKSIKPVILHSYPPSQCALANLYEDQKGDHWSKRFEVYANGLELGNAFDELTDPGEQRNRFEKDMRLRKIIYGEGFKPNPIDEEFLDAVGQMPPSAGIAMGVDRIVMYFFDLNRIDEALWLDSYWPM